MCRQILQLLQLHTWLGELGNVIFPVLGTREEGRVGGDST